MSAFGRMDLLLRELGRLPIDNSVRPDMPDVITCPVCGQKFDKSDLAALLYHDRPYHPPIQPH